MKKRLGFVTNSSSTSYMIVRNKKVESEEDVKDIALYRNAHECFDKYDDILYSGIGVIVGRLRYLPNIKNYVGNFDTVAELDQKIEDWLVGMIRSGKTIYYLRAGEDEEESRDPTFDRKKDGVFFLGRYE